MKQKFTANILFLIGINILIKPFYALGIDTSVQNIVGPESYGLFLAIFNSIYIQQIFADMGVQNYNNRNISQHPEKLSKLLPSVLGSKLVFTGVFILVTLLTAGFMGYTEYLSEILLWVIGSQAMLSMLLYLRTNISGMGMYFTDSLVSVMDKLILILWMSYVIWGNPGIADITISYFAMAQFISLAITVVMVLILTNKKLVRLRVMIDFAFMKDLLRKTLPYASLVLLMAGYSRVDGIMLEQLLDDNALSAGEYARSFRLYDTFNNFTFLFAVLLLPMFSRMIKAGEDVNEVVRWAFRLLGMFSVFAIITVYWEGSALMEYFYEDYTDDRAWTLVFLMMAGLSLSLNYIYGTLLTANGSIKILNIIALSGFMVNITFNYFVIPLHGPVGAAVATFITQTIVLVAQVYFCYQYFSLKGLLPAMIRIGVIGLLSFVAFGSTATLTYVPTLIKIIVVGLLYIAMAFIVRLIRPADLRMV